MCVSELEKLSHIHNINYSGRYQLNFEHLLLDSSNAKFACIYRKFCFYYGLLIEDGDVNLIDF